MILVAYLFPNCRLRKSCLGYSLRNSDYVQPIEMQLSNKQKLLSQFLLNFENLHEILNILIKNDPRS